MLFVLECFYRLFLVIRPSMQRIMRTLKPNWSLQYLLDSF
jgi:hypothetical protein